MLEVAVEDAGADEATDAFVLHLERGIGGRDDAETAPAAN
jgi:hypothetical protein